MLEGVNRSESAAPVTRSSTVVDGVGALESSAWNALCAPGQGPLRHGYVCAWENAHLEGLRARPIAVHGDDETLAAAAHAYFYELDMGGIHSHVALGALHMARRLYPRLLKTRVYEVGSPTALVPPVLRPTKLSPAAGARAVLRTAVREADRGGAQLMIVQNFATPVSPEAPVLRELGFSPVPIPPTVVLDLPFGDFDEYLAAMRSHYRRRARKVLKKSRHLEVERVHDFAPLAPRLAQLWRLVYERADVRREILGEAYFRGAAGVDETSVLVLRRADGSIASYALLLDDRPWLHFLYCGFEQQAGLEESAYFRLIYEIVRDALERGFEHVNLGITTLEPKLDAGGRVVPLYGWIRHRRRALHGVFARLAAGPFAPGIPEPRTVFKG